MFCEFGFDARTDRPKFGVQNADLVVGTCSYRRACIAAFRPSEYEPYEGWPACPGPPTAQVKEKALLEPLAANASSTPGPARTTRFRFWGGSRNLPAQLSVMAALEAARYMIRAHPITIRGLRSLGHMPCGG